MITWKTILLIAACIWKQYAYAENTMYLFKIQPHSGAISEPWCGIYQGKPLIFSGNVALIKVDKMTPTFSIIITPCLTFCQAGCTISSLSRCNNLSMKWFDLSLILEDGEWKWYIHELQMHEVPLQIPYHAIVIFLDPELIDELRVPECIKYARNLIHQDNAPIFELPTIVLKDTPRATIELSCKKGHLGYLDIRWIHAATTSEERIMDCVVLKQTTTRDL